MNRFFKDFCTFFNNFAKFPDYARIYLILLEKQARFGCCAAEVCNFPGTEDGFAVHPTFAHFCESKT